MRRYIVFTDTGDYVVMAYGAQNARERVAMLTHGEAAVKRVALAPGQEPSLWEPAE